MADIFDFYVYDDRSIQFTLAEPIMLEDKDVTQFRFRIPKSLNGFDMSTWAWWFVYVNALGTKYSVPLTLTDDEDDPDNYSTATFTVNYGMSEKSGKVSFAIEVIDANTGGDILHEWHTKTYTTTVEETLQCNQVEYAEDESDIISALIQQVQALVAQGGLDATGVTSGYVPTADGNDGWSWQDIAVVPTEITITDSGAVTQELQANVAYHFTSDALTSLTITLAATSDIAQYHFDFISPSTAVTLTLPSTVVMPANFSVDADTRYEIDILNGYGVAQNWAVSANA